MVTKTDKCSYTEFKIYPGKGRRFIGRDGRLHYFISNKARSLFHQKIKPVKLTWTLTWRAFHKKTKVDEFVKKRTKKTTRVQRAVVGMSLAEIQRRKAETREQRDKQASAAAQEVKDRKQKQIAAKKIEKAKIAKVQNVSKAAPKAAAAPKKAAGGARKK